MAHLLNLEGLQGSVVNWASVVTASCLAAYAILGVLKVLHATAAKWIRVWGEAYLKQARNIEPPPHAYKQNPEREVAIQQGRAARSLLGKASRLNKALLWLAEPAVDDGKGSPLIRWSEPPNSADEASEKFSHGEVSPRC